MVEESRVSCDEFRQQLAAFRDGELDACASALIREHLEACPPCAELAAADRRIDEAIKAKLREAPVPDLFLKRIAKIIEQAQKPHP